MKVLVTACGDRQEAIFEDETDRQKFLEILGKVTEQMRWICLGYCLMDNHYHLIVATPDANLARGMRQLNGIYTQAGNHRHIRQARWRINDRPDPIRSTKSSLLQQVVHLDVESTYSPL